MRQFIIVSTLFCLALFAAAALSAGGKNQWSNPNFADGCVAQLPAGIDLDTCELVPSGDSALQTYYCKGEVITVECVDDGPQPPGQSR